MKWKRFFSLLATQQGKDGQEVLETKLDLEQLQVKTWLMLMLSEHLNIADSRLTV